MRDSRRALFFHRRWAVPRFGVNYAPAIYSGRAPVTFSADSWALMMVEIDGEGVLRISSRRCADFKELFGLSVSSARSESRPANTRLQATVLRAAQAGA